LHHGHFPLKAEFAPGKIRCLLVHDHVLLRQGLRRLLEDEPDLEVVAEADSVAQGLPLILQRTPDVVITEPAAFRIPPDELERSILRASPQSKVLFLTAQKGIDPSQDGSAERSASAVRQTSAKDLVEMIRAGCFGGKGEVREILREIPRGAPSGPPAPSSRKVLTARERQVLELLAEGKTVRSAAATLGLSVKTVDAHKFNLMRKLGLHNKAELVMWAIQKRIVNLPVNF